VVDFPGNMLIDTHTLRITALVGFECASRGEPGISEVEVGRGRPSLNRNGGRHMSVLSTCYNLNVTLGIVPVTTGAGLLRIGLPMYRRTCRPERRPFSLSSLEGSYVQHLHFDS